MVPAIEKMNAADIPVTEVTDRSVGESCHPRAPDDYQIALALARRLFKEMGGRATSSSSKASPALRRTPSASRVSTMPSRRRRA